MFANDLPAFWAIVTIVPIRFCCTLHKPVIRRGSIHPSERKNWLKINTSVCFTSRPRVHLRQNFCLPPFSAVGRRISWFSRGDCTYLAAIERVSFCCSTRTVNGIETNEVMNDYDCGGRPTNKTNLLSCRIACTYSLLEPTQVLHLYVDEMVR